MTELYVTEALDRVEAEEAGPGEIIAVAGIPEVTIGETLADPDDPRPLPPITIDEPSLSMTIGINTSPLAGLDGDKVTASLVEARLRAELVGNVSLRVLPTEPPDAWEVQGRGELQLAVLVEQMRREGFELTVGKPQVVTREIDGVLHEPVERVSIDAPEEYLGVVTQLFALRKGRTEALVNHGTRLGADGRARPRARPDRLPHRVPDGDARHRASSTTSSSASSRGPASFGRGRRARSSPTAAARRPRSRCSSSRSAARSSSRRASTSTRG